MWALGVAGGQMTAHSYLAPGRPSASLLSREGRAEPNGPEHEVVEGLQIATEGYQVTLRGSKERSASSLLMSWAPHSRAVA